MHSQRASEKPLQPWIIVEKDGKVLRAHCDCMAGLGESCTHVGALLFAVEAAVRGREKKTVTQTAAYWMVPPAKEIPYQPIAEIDFTSAKSKKRQLDAMIECSSPVPIKRGSSACTSAETSTPTPTEEELDRLYSTLSQSRVKSALLSLVSPYSDDFIPTVLNRRFPTILTELFDEQASTLPYNELLEKCRTVKLSITEEEISNFEEATRAQAGSKLWYSFRAGRITASKPKAACHTDLSLPSQSLVKSVCYPEMARFTSAATTWGCEHEKAALNAYRELMEATHPGFRVTHCGFFIHPTLPHLGSSPDGILSCECCGDAGCCEVKCPFCKKGETIAEAAEDKAFCLQKDEDGHIRLKRTHAYYYQVQSQLHTATKEYCDFVVWTQKSIHMERILTDEEFCNVAVEKATGFFKLGVLPELVDHFYTRPTPRQPFDKPGDIEAASQKITGSLWCYCRKEEGDGMAVCSNKECPVKKFHIVCIGLKRVPQKATWYCPDCRKLAQFKRQRKTKN